MTATRHNPIVCEPQSAAVTPLRVALVADDEVTTRGLASILRDHDQHFEFVTIASRDLAPIDIALYDPVMGGASRLERLVKLLADDRVRRVAIFTNREASRALEFIEQGACAYLPKSLSGAEIVDALIMVNSGQTVLLEGASSGRARQGRVTSHDEVLTPREAQVLSLIAEGCSNKVISQKLGLSANTVKFYIRTCYRKIEVDSRSKAVLWALNHGLVDAQASTVRPVD